MKPGKRLGHRLSTSCLGFGTMQHPLNYWNMPQREVLLWGIVGKVNFCSNEKTFIRLQILTEKNFGSHFKSNEKYL